jgi:hypothetical protein
VSDIEMMLYAHRLDHNRTLSENSHVVENINPMDVVE